ncbi:MAG TPA: hypothetical protein VHX65_03400 [Pirellulales bacterium]|jgi:hypothetical protein|nr:hypothetical protein [Pirellulales bacterium]
MGQILALIWIAVALLLSLVWAATDLVHNRLYGNWDVGRTLSRLPIVMLVALGWPVLLPASCLERMRRGKR